MTDGGADRGISLLFDVFVVHQRVRALLARALTGSDLRAALQALDDAAGTALAQFENSERVGTGALTELREAIRCLLATHTGGREDAEAARRLTVALSCGRLVTAIDPGGGASLLSADHDPFARVVGSVAIAIAEAGAAGTWARLKSCPGQLCGWAFYDRSSSARSRWCSMQVCGARAKMRAYRDRRLG